MQATLHAIEARLTDDELAPATLANFRLGQAEPTGADRAVVEPGWTLYCLDLPGRRALFLDIGPDVDLARSAFVKATQFRLARRALMVPFEALDGLAAAIPAPERLIFVFSIGRCGSTLVNAMLNEVPTVWALSEPDFTFDLVMQRASFDPEEARGLLAAGYRLLFQPPPGRGADTLAVKLRRQDRFHADRVRAVFPNAAYVFLYREGEAWARSFWPPELDPEARRFLWWIESANIDPAALEGVVDMAAETVWMDELIAAGWAIGLTEYRRLRAAGVPFLAIRYDELDADRAAVAERLLRHCRLPPSAAPAALRAFERDSQEGTVLARDRRAGGFGEANLARFRATLARWPGGAPADAMLPDIYSA